MSSSFLHCHHSPSSFAGLWKATSFSMEITHFFRLFRLQRFPNFVFDYETIYAHWCTIIAGLLHPAGLAAVSRKRPFRLALTGTTVVAELPSNTVSKLAPSS